MLLSYEDKFISIFFGTTRIRYNKIEMNKADNKYSTII